MYAPADAAFGVDNGFDAELAKVEKEIQDLEERRTRLTNARAAANKEVDQRELELERWIAGRGDEWLEHALSLSLHLESAHTKKPAIR